MAKKKRTQVTPSQIDAAVTSAQTLPLVAALVAQMARSVRINSELSGTPMKGKSSDCTFSALIAFLFFRSIEVLLKAKIGMEGDEFLEIHRLTLLYDKLPDAEKQRMENEWQSRKTALREDANRILRPHAFRETLAFLDTLNLNECLYWWAQENFSLDQIDNLMEYNGEIGILPDVSAVVNDTAVVRSGMHYVETSYAEMLAPLFEEKTKDNPLLIVRGKVQ